MITWALLIRMSTIEVKFSPYLSQTINTDLRVIRKVQYATTSCWRFRIISSFYSTYLFKM